MSYILGHRMSEKKEKAHRDQRISIRATQKTMGQLTELQRILGERLGSPVSQGQAVAMAIDALVASLYANPGQRSLFN